MTASSRIQDEQLLQVCKDGDIAILKTLMRGGTNLEHKDQCGWTALHTACFHGSFAVACCLIDEGSRLDAVNENGQSALHLASQNGNISCVSYLLSQQCNPNAMGKWKETPLMDASLYGHLVIVIMLIEHGAKINAKNDRQQSALELAQKRGHTDIADYLRIVTERDIPTQKYFQDLKTFGQRLNSSLARALCDGTCETTSGEDTDLDEKRETLTCLRDEGKRLASQSLLAAPIRRWLSHMQLQLEKLTGVRRTRSDTAPETTTTLQVGIDCSSPEMPDTKNKLGDLVDEKDRLRYELDEMRRQCLATEMNLQETKSQLNKEKKSRAFLSRQNKQLQDYIQSIFIQLERQMSQQQDHVKDMMIRWRRLQDADYLPFTGINKYGHEKGERHAGETLHVSLQLPVTDDRIVEIVSKAAGDTWERMGRALGFSGTAVNDILSVAPARLRDSDKLFRIICEWRLKEGNKATLDKLLEACDRVERKGIVEMKLADEHLHQLE